VIIVVATTVDGIADVQARLRGLGVTPTEIRQPSDVRRLVLAPVPDEARGASVVARLRTDGHVAVLRPEAGPRLEAWTHHTRPISVGQRLCLCFAWSEHDRRGLSHVVELDPDGGFGSGQHPSTRLLLEILTARIAGGERVIDVGCGSGVLALSALRLGASSAVGVDVEAAAIEATRRNAGLNGFGPRLEARLPPMNQIGGVFDVVLANIGRAALLELSADLSRLVSPGGWIAVSGFAPTQCSVVAAAMRPLEVVENRTWGEWSALVFACRRAEHSVSGSGPSSRH
jgi:ribosomal protein L11 methylase PrmA